MFKSAFEAAVASSLQDSRAFDLRTLRVLGYPDNETGIGLVVAGQRNRAVDPTGAIAVAAFFAPTFSTDVYTYGPDIPDDVLKGDDASGRVYEVGMTTDRPGLRVEMVRPLKTLGNLPGQAGSLALNGLPAEELRIESPASTFGLMHPGDVEAGLRAFKNMVHTDFVTQIHSSASS